MFAYHSDQNIKNTYIARMKAHMEADALIQGTGWNGHKGCAVGCTFEDYDHARGPVEIGVPEPLMWLEDCIFEGLPDGQAKGFPLAFLEAIPVGADLSLVWPRFALWLLADPNHGVLQHTGNATRPAVEAVIDLYRRWLDGDQPSADEFEVAAEAAWAAAEAATWAAAEAAWAAAEAPWAAWRAARTATRNAAAAAEEGFWGAARDELLRLLREAPVAEEAGL